MTLVVQNPTATFKTAIALQPRVASGLIAAGLMGNVIGRNLYGAAALSVKGSPAKVAGYNFVSTLSQDNYLDTNIDDSADMTLMIAAKLFYPTSGTPNQQIIGSYTNYKGAQSYVGTGIALSPNGPAVGVIGRTSADGATSGNKNITSTLGLPTGAANATWNLLALRVARNTPANTGGFGGDLKNMTAGVVVTTGVFGTDARLSGLANTLKVGATNRQSDAAGTTIASITGSFDVLGFAVYNRCLTDTELQSQYLQFKGIAAAEGITL